MRSNAAVKIKLHRLKRNFGQLKKEVKAKVLFMVKANAYGHGVDQLVHYCLEEKLCSSFGVANIDEAISLRKNLPYLEFEIYVFSDLDFSTKEHRESYIQYRLLPVISNWENLELFLQDPLFKLAPLVLKFNTGMNRIGLEDAALVRELLVKHERKEIFHLMTHFSDSSVGLNQKTKDQYQSFKNIKDDFLSHGISIKETSVANSGAIEQKFGIEESFIRPGIMLYGPSSLIPGHKDLSFYQGEVISSLCGRVIHHKEVTKGTPIGYGSSRAPYSGYLFYLPLGYGDGLSYHWSGLKLPLKFGEGQCVGRLNMDMLAWLLPQGQAGPKLHEEVCLWDNRENLSLIAQHLKTIPYEILTHLNNRIPRVYHREE